jgi:class 3 adenylate cyclase
VVDQLGAERASLIGSFVGANIALETAVRFPDRVASAIAMHPRLFPPDTDHEAVRDRMLKVVDRDAAAGRNELALAAPTRVSEPGFADWFARVGRMAASPSSATQFWEAASRPSSLRARVGAIEAPVLLLCRRDYADHGGVDDLTKIAAEIPAGRCVVLEGADGLVNAGDVDGLVFEVAEFLLGERHSATTLRPVVSVLFTDLVGSTATARSMGDTDWRTVLDHHDRLIDRTVRRYGGAMVKATGDGALTIFDAPSRALHCAVALREQLARFGLQVRMGVHLGEIERRGDDVAGVAVHLTSRVMSAGNAGDILTTVAVPLATLGGGFTFESCGQHELKGFDETFELFRLAEKD